MLLTETICVKVSPTIKALIDAEARRAGARQASVIRDLLALGAITFQTTERDRLRAMLGRSGPLPPPLTAPAGSASGHAPSLGPDAALPLPPGYRVVVSPDAPAGSNLLSHKVPQP